VGITVYRPGDRVHRWVIVRHSPEKRAYECKCDCRQVAFITVGSLRSGTSRHCIACRRREESGNPEAIIVSRRGAIDIT
jgi:hypothetical protein